MVDFKELLPDEQQKEVSDRRTERQLIEGPEPLSRFVVHALCSRHKIKVLVKTLKFNFT